MTTRPLGTYLKSEKMKCRFHEKRRMAERVGRSYAERGGKPRESNKKEKEKDGKKGERRLDGEASGEMSRRD